MRHNYSIVQFVLLCYAGSLYYGLDSVTPVIRFYSLTRSLKGSLNVTFHGFDCSQFFIYIYILLVSLCDWLIWTLTRDDACRFQLYACWLHRIVTCCFSSCTRIHFFVLVLWPSSNNSANFLILPHFLPYFKKLIVSLLYALVFGQKCFGAGVANLLLRETVINCYHHVYLHVLFNLLFY